MEDPEQNWENVQIYHSGDDFFSDMIKDIRLAQKSIQIEVYIFNVDQFTKVLLKELAAARVRGLDVQILVDGFGSFQSLGGLQKICNQENLNLKIFRPLPMSETGFRKYFFKYLFKLKYVLRRLNKRNHRKITFIDSQIAYIGSFNNTGVHSKSLKGKKSWRDTGVRLIGPELKHIQFSMNETWKWNRRARILSFFKNKLWNYVPEKSLIRLNTRRRWRQRLNHDLKLKIQQAQKQVLITSAYFLPTGPLLRALKKAARKGTRVQIIVPGPSDVPLVNLAALKLYANLHKAGVRVYQYQPEILHAKNFIIDDFFMIGSMNLNHRSLLHDLEVTVVLNDESSKKNLLDQWLIDLNQSHEFSYLSYEKLSALTQLLARLAFRFRYWL